MGCCLCLGMQDYGCAALRIPEYAKICLCVYGHPPKREWLDLYLK